MTTKPKTVLMFMPQGEAFAQMVSKGVSECAAAMHWSFVTVECIRSDGGVAVARSPVEAGTVAELVALMRPDGVIVWGTVATFSELRGAGGEHLPVVFIDRPFSANIPDEGRKGCVHGDAAAIAAMAARELLSSGWGDFAFVPYKVDAPWNHERGDAFAHCIALAGKRCHNYERREASPTPLARWLESLPKPCGVLAANDVTGEEVLVACATAGISVPDEIAVVSVDNLRHICEATSPTLTSIAMDHFREGRAAAALLGRWMENPGAPPPSVSIPPLFIERRSSSRFLRDRRVAKALESIRLHACEEDFAVTDAIREMRLGRSQAFALFRAVTGRTMLDEVHAVRLARARELLMARKPSDIVAAQCGYSSYNDFLRVFKRCTGKTVRQWTLENRH